MQASKQHRFTLALVGGLWLALVLGCTSLKEIANSGQNSSPVASPANTATTSSPPSRSSADNSPNTANGTATSGGVTLANYDRLQTGMTYAQVVQILGKQGEKMSSNEVGSLKIEMYRWDGNGGRDSEMHAFFQNGKLDKKMQFALK